MKLTINDPPDDECSQDDQRRRAKGVSVRAQPGPGTGRGERTE